MAPHPQQGAAGPEVAHIVEVLEGQVMYRTDARKGPPTRHLELRVFLGLFAPPGADAPLMDEADPGSGRGEC